MPGKAFVRVALLVMAAATSAAALEIKSATFDDHARSVRIIYDNGPIQINVVLEHGVRECGAKPQLPSQL
jgi:hypothetical protein